MAECEVEATGDSPPGVQPSPGTQASPSTLPALSAQSVPCTQLAPCTRESPLLEQSLTASSTLTALSSTESSVTEGRPDKGTPLTVEGNTPVSQSENGAAEFLDSMTAVLNPAQGDSSKKSPVRPQLGNQGLGSVRGSAVGSSFVSSVAGLSVQGASSRVSGPRANLSGLSQAESSRIAAALPRKFESQLVLHGEPSNPVSSNYVIGLGVSVPTAASFSGFGSSGTGASPSLRGPSGPSKQGQEGSLQPNVSSLLSQSNQLNDGQMTLGSLPLETLSPSDVLFYFGVLCIIGRLAPQFTFKYGGKDAKQIGTRLVMYGHTVLVAPTSDSAHMARVVASGRALVKMRKYHPDWLIPPLPLNGPTQAQWNWVDMLHAFCGEVNWPAPIYNASILGNQWHCELYVNGLFFRTFQGSGNMDQAQNAVSHHALHQLLITDNIHVGDILPPGSQLVMLPEVKKPVAPPTEEAIRNRTRLLLNAVESLRPYPAEPKKAESLQTAVDALKTRLKNEQTRPPGKVSGLSGGKVGKQTAKPAKPVQPPAQKKPVQSSEKPKNLPLPLRPSRSRGPRGRESRASRRNGHRITPPPRPPTKVEAKGKNKESFEDARLEPERRPNANLEPLKNSRLAPIELKDVPVVDPLATLKAIQDGLVVLSPHASFLRVMKIMCFVLKIAEPDIRHEQVPDDESGQIHSMYAHFDDPNPFLTRASPVFLGNVCWIDEDTALALAVKKVILFLLKMCKDEVEVDVLETAWDNELAWLHGLEREVEHRLRQVEN